MGPCMSKCITDRPQHHHRTIPQKDDLGIADPAPTTRIHKPDTIVGEGEAMHYDQAVNKANAESIHSYMEGVSLKDTDNYHIDDIETLDDYTCVAETTSIQLTDERLMEYYELGFAIAQSTQKPNKTKPTQPTSDPIDHTNPFVPHMSIEEANALQIGDPIDYRLECGMFVYALVSEKRKSYLTLQYKDDKGMISESECDYTQHIYRFAQPSTIAQRPCTDSEFIGLDVDKNIEINPIHTPHVGWKIGRIVRFEYKYTQKLQVQIEYEDENKTKHTYWTHLDNHNEVQRLGTNVFDDDGLQTHVAQPTIQTPLDDEDELDLEAVEEAIQEAVEDISNVEYVLHKEGPIERYKASWINVLSEWERLWMVMYGATLQFYEDETKRKLVDQTHLMDYTAILRSGTISFTIYKASSKEIQCRVIDAADLEEREEWIEYIKKVMGIEEQDMIKEEIAIAYPKHDTKFIQTKFKNFDDDSVLKCRFVQNENTKHAELIVYDVTPDNDDDIVITIDLVYDTKDMSKGKKSIVRLQSETWRHFKRRDVRNDQQLVHKPLSHIIMWCIEYQTKWPNYTTSRNCRTFMIELCEFVEIAYPDTYPFEGVLYKLGTVTSAVFASMNPSALFDKDEDVIEVSEDDQKAVEDSQDTAVTRPKENDKGTNEALWECPQCTCLNALNLPLVCDACEYQLDS